MNISKSGTTSINDVDITIQTKLIPRTPVHSDMDFKFINKSKKTFTNSTKSAFEIYQPKYSEKNTIK